MLLTALYPTRALPQGHSKVTHLEATGLHLRCGVGPAGYVECPSTRNRAKFLRLPARAPQLEGSAAPKAFRRAANIGVCRWPPGHFVSRVS